MEEKVCHLLFYSGTTLGYIISFLYEKYFRINVKVHSDFFQRWRQLPIRKILNANISNYKAFHSISSAYVYVCMDTHWKDFVNLESIRIQLRGCRCHFLKLSIIRLLIWYNTSQRLSIITNRFWITDLIEWP